MIVSGGLSDDERVLRGLRGERGGGGDARARLARQPLALRPPARAPTRASPATDEVVDELEWVIDGAEEHLGAERAGRYLRKFYPWYAETLGLTKREREPLVTAPDARPTQRVAALVADRLRRWPPEPSPCGLDRIPVATLLRPSGGSKRRVFYGTRNSPHTSGPRGPQGQNRATCAASAGARWPSASRRRASSATSPRTPSTTTPRTSRRCSRSRSPTSRRSSRSARVIDEKDVDTDVVSVGVTVHVKDQKTDKSTKFRIVGSAEAEPVRQQALERVAGRQGPARPQARRDRDGPGAARPRAQAEDHQDRALAASRPGVAPRRPAGVRPWSRYSVPRVDDRRAKLERLREQGIDPFPHEFDGRRADRRGARRARRTRGRRGDRRAPTASPAGWPPGAATAARRSSTWSTARGKLQVHAKRDVLGEESFDTLTSLDLGDLIGVDGTAFKSRRGELSLRADGLDAAGQVAAGAAREVPRPRGRGDPLPPPRARPDRQRGDARAVHPALEGGPRHPPLARRARLPRGRDADPPAALRRRAGAAVRDPPQRAGPRPLPADRRRALPQAPDRRAASSASTRSARTSATRASPTSTTPSSRCSSGTRPTRTTRTSPPGSRS